MNTPEEHKLEICPKCGIKVVDPRIECECGCELGLIHMFMSNRNAALRAGWREYENKNGTGCLIPPNRDCSSVICEYYPKPHRHRIDNVQEVEVFEEFQEDSEKAELAQLNAEVIADFRRETREALLKMTNDELVALALKRDLDPSEYGFDETNSEILWLEKMFPRLIETTTPATAEPELGKRRCPNGHDSSLPPRLPELIFEACGHYRPTVATWNEFCITCGVRHVALRIYWRGHEGRYGSRVNNPKNYCGYCGAKMVCG